MLHVNIFWVHVSRVSAINESHRGKSFSFWHLSSSKRPTRVCRGAHVHLLTSQETDSFRNCHWNGVIFSLWGKSSVNVEGYGQRVHQPVVCLLCWRSLAFSIALVRRKWDCWPTKEKKSPKAAAVSKRTSQKKTLASCLLKFQLRWGFRWVGVFRTRKTPGVRLAWHVAYGNLSSEMVLVWDIWVGGSEDQVIFFFPLCNPRLNRDQDVADGIPQDWFPFLLFAPSSEVQVPPALSDMDKRIPG